MYHLTKTFDDFDNNLIRASGPNLRKRHRFFLMIFQNLWSKKTIWCFMTTLVLKIIAIKNGNNYILNLTLMILSRIYGIQVRLLLVSEQIDMLCENYVVGCTTLYVIKFSHACGLQDVRFSSGEQSVFHMFLTHTPANIICMKCLPRHQSKFLFFFILETNISNQTM